MVIFLMQSSEENGIPPQGNRQQQSANNDATRRASVSNSPASPDGSASLMIRSGTNAWGLLAGTPTRSPALCAVAFAAKTSLRPPVRLVRMSAALAGGAASKSLRTSLSVGRVGRKSETTLGIAGLQIGGFPGGNGSAQLATWHGPPPAPVKAPRAARSHASGSQPLLVFARNPRHRFAGSSGGSRCRSRRNSAVSCNRRELVVDRGPISPTTPPRPLWR
jgi:hypothetical protein